MCVCVYCTIMHLYMKFRNWRRTFFLQFLLNCISNQWQARQSFLIKKCILNKWEEYRCVIWKMKTMEIHFNVVIAITSMHALSSVEMWKVNRLIWEQCWQYTHKCMYFCVKLEIVSDRKWWIRQAVNLIV